MYDKAENAEMATSETTDQKAGHFAPPTRPPSRPITDEYAPPAELPPSQLERSFTLLFSFVFGRLVLSWFVAILIWYPITESFEISKVLDRLSFWVAIDLTLMIVHLDAVALREGFWEMNTSENYYQAFFASAVCTFGVYSMFSLLNYISG